MAPPWTSLVAQARPAGTRSVAEVAALLARIESDVQRAPHEAFAVGADGALTLAAGGATYAAGRFETPSIGELVARARAVAPAEAGRVRLSILRGDNVATDIGALQAGAGEGALFQVASQFNCLEAPSRHIVPIAAYPHDRTQGPRASVSAFAGTFARHYFAPRADGTRFVQRDNDCLDLLADALPASAGRAQSGYLTAGALADPAAAAAALAARFEHIRVGLHAGVEVSLGADWGGPVEAPRRIAQVFTSTIALGAYSSARGGALDAVMHQLLRAAYLGTLLGAAALRQRSVVLTLIGGGVFGNPHRAIWDAIHGAVAEVERIGVGPLDVLVNARTDAVAEQDFARSRASGGVQLALFDAPHP